MENKFYEHNFEQFLKESADQFRISPSKKVWHGIYNDTHPGRRWPSIAMSLLFVFTLVLVGHLNIQQNQRKLNYPTIAQKNNTLRNTDNKENKLLVQPDKSVNTTNEKNVSQHNPLMASTYDLSTNLLNIKDDNSAAEKSLKVVFNDDNKVKTANAAIISNSLATKSIINEISIESNELPEDALLPKNNMLSELTTNIILNSPKLTGNALKAVTSDIDFAGAEIKHESRESNVIQSDNISPATKVESRNKATHVQRIKIHRNPKITWAYYLSPSVSYRNYSKYIDDADLRYLAYLNNSINPGSNRAITHRPSAGLEAGFTMKYSLAKKLKFTSGFQFNYSAYSMQANNIHPIIATLVLHNENTGMPYAVSSISYFSNGPGTVPENLHNYNWQLSLPVGLEYELAGNNRIQWNVAATLQPSVVLAKRAYILTTDKRNYISAASISRPLNLNTNIGTFISFNSNKFKWQLGPQLNYQLLSSYKKQYQLREHFINYGIRLGVSKIIK